MTRVRSKAAPRSRSNRPPVDTQNSTDTRRPLKIGEAARLVGVEAYVLRFWETQFNFLRPKHSRSKHRFYEPRDIDTLKLVKRLLHTQGYTIAGARKHITDLGLDRLLDGYAAPETESAPAVADSNHHSSHAVSIATAASSATGTLEDSVQRRLAEIRDDLRSLHKLLEH
jgi:DNA-binding transcriptional MerR regulator